MAPRTLLLLVAAAATPAAAGDRLEAVPAAEGIHVHVAKRGVFSAFAHDHDFEVTRWRGTAEVPDGDPGRVSVELVLEAGSLRDREPGLSEDDRRKVEAQTAGPKVLDAANHPEIVFRSQGVTLEPPSGPASTPLRGTLHGELTLRGRARPLDVSFEAERRAERWLVRGGTRFRQSEFGIEPFSGAWGTVGVKDQLEITFALELRGAE